MLGFELLGNTLWDYLLAAGTFIGALVALVVLRRYVLDRLQAWIQKTKGGDELSVKLLGQVRVREGLLLAAYLATRYLDLNGRLDRLLSAVVVLALTYRAARILQIVSADALRRAVLPEGTPAPAQQGTARALTYLTDALIVLGGLIFALGALGIKVTALVAGLGIGGVAVALAAQAVLGDVFSAIAIFLDKPFVVGDAVSVDGLQGTVEHIGMKTTRVRSLSGEMLVFPNSLLTSSKIRNYQNMLARRVLFGFGVSRRTPADKIKRVVELVKEIVSRAPRVRLDRAHFKGIGEFSLDFEVVYHVLDADYNRYMDLNESIQLGILEALRKEGVELANPTRTVIQESPAPHA